MPMSDQDKYLLSIIRKTEYWQALEKWLLEEISLLEIKEENSAKICDDPLNEDFRVQLGIKIGLKRVLRKPQECFENINTKGD